MPEFILPDEADHCPHCNAVLCDPPNCCAKMIAEHEARWRYDEEPDRGNADIDGEPRNPY